MSVRARLYRLCSFAPRPSHLRDSGVAGGVGRAHALRSATASRRVDASVSCMYRCMCTMVCVLPYMYHIYSTHRKQSLVTVGVLTLAKHFFLFFTFFCFFDSLKHFWIFYIFLCRTLF